MRSPLIQVFLISTTRLSTENPQDVLDEKVKNLYSSILRFGDTVQIQTQPTKESIVKSIVCAINHSLPIQGWCVFAHAVGGHRSDAAVTLNSKHLLAARLSLRPIVSLDGDEQMHPGKGSA
jgi:hypothetical protein